MAKSRALLNVFNLVNSSEKELPVQEQFLNDLKTSIQKQDEKDARQPSKTYKPSSLHCMRNMYYQVTGAQGEAGNNTSELIGICESGSDPHERIQNAVMQMKDNGIDCEYVDVAAYVFEKQSHGNLMDLEIVSKQGFETKLYNKRLNMSFLCDGIIKYKGVYYILEIKTEKSTKFWDRKDVNPDHILQGTAYSLNLGISQVVFVYECRDDCNKKAYMLDVTDEMRNELENRILECNGYVERMVPPPISTENSRKACMYCGYAKLCRGT